MALRSIVAVPVTGLRAANVEPGNLKDLERTRFRPEGIPPLIRPMNAHSPVGQAAAPAEPPD